MLARIVVITCEQAGRNEHALKITRELQIVATRHGALRPTLWSSPPLSVPWHQGLLTACDCAKLLQIWNEAVVCSAVVCG